jgi:hypothetical protein
MVRMSTATYREEHASQSEYFGVVSSLGSGIRQVAAHLTLSYPHRYVLYYRAGSFLLRRKRKKGEICPRGRQEKMKLNLSGLGGPRKPGGAKESEYRCPMLKIMLHRYVQSGLCSTVIREVFPTEKGGKQAAM